ncbi:hypothetical protein BVRB_3g054940 [Beta vulgaris subsp. vulgaris]|nr:hypothetical protein BVRB_3g054940 [Beta vulgaris subsp. vulgaris]
MLSFQEQISKIWMKIQSTPSDCYSDEFSYDDYAGMGI